jgi:hypothetical protein
MWFACHFLLCEYLLLVAALVGLHILRVDAVIGNARFAGARVPIRDAVHSSHSVWDAQSQVEEPKNAHPSFPRSIVKLRSSNLEGSHDTHQSTSENACSALRY